MARIEFPVWSIARAALAMPFRYPLAFLKFGFIPLLIAFVALPPAINVGRTTTVIVNGSLVNAPSEEPDQYFSTTDSELGWRDLIGFVVMLPFAAAFAAAWNRLTATGAEWEMGRPPIAFDARTIGVVGAFVRMMLVMFGVALVLAVCGLLVFGHYRDGTLSYNVSVNGLGPTMAAMAGLLVIALAVTWFMLRFSLIIPAAAMGAPLSLRESWRLSKPIQFRVLAIGVILSVTYFLLLLLLSLTSMPLAIGLGFRPAFYIAVAGSFPILAYGHAIWAGMLGATYGLLRPQYPGTDLSKVFD